MGAIFKGTLWVVLGLTLAYGLMRGCAVLSEKQRQDRQRAQNLQNAQRAVDEGHSFGTPPPNDPVRFVAPKINAARDAAKASGDRYTEQRAFLDIREELKALPDTPRKQEVYYTLASYQAMEGFASDGAQTAGLIDDAEKRAGFFIAAGSNYVKDPEQARQQFFSARVEIGQIQASNPRDSLYAQLAFAQKTRGLLEDQKQTCSLIVLPEYKNSTTCPEAHR